MILLAAFGYGFLVTALSAVFLRWRVLKDWQPTGAIIANSNHADIWLLLGCIIMGFLGFVGAVLCDVLIKTAFK